jgi:protease PrsW
MAEWYFADHEEVRGPYTPEEMKSLRQEEIIGEGTPVKQEGDMNWSLFYQTDLSAVPNRQAGRAGFSNQVKGAFLHTTARINEMVGEKGNIDLQLKDVFSAVMQKHTREERELLFIAGTSVTTPPEEDIPTSWPKPWLFSRVFLVLALTFLMLYVAAFSFYNMNALPGLIFIGAFTVPFSLLIFFWETNAPRNISIVEVVKMFFVGGVASIVATLFFFSVFPVYELTVGGAIVVGVMEEVGKLVIIAYFIHQLKVKYILNGLLIGAAIGAGFAAFESAGYAFNIGLAFGEAALIQNIFDRAWLSIGGHVVWAGITGAALVLVKGAGPLAQKHLTDPAFLKLFAVPVVLHSLWNMPIYFFDFFYFRYLVLIVIAWIFIFTLMNAGLKQISRQHSI